MIWTSPKLPRGLPCSFRSRLFPTWRSPHCSPWKPPGALRFSVVRPPCRVVSGTSPGPGTQNDSACAPGIANGDSSKRPSASARVVNVIWTPPLRYLKKLPAFAVTAIVIVVAVEVHHARVVDHFPGDYGEHGADFPRVRVAHPEEVAVEHHEIGELALFDRAELVLPVHVPGVAARVRVERLLARDLTSGVDLLSEHVEAGGGVVQREPRVMRRDVHAVLVHACGDAAREDLRIERTDRQPVGARHAIQP